MYKCEIRYKNNPYVDYEQLEKDDIFLNQNDTRNIELYKVVNSNAGAREFCKIKKIKYNIFEQPSKPIKFVDFGQLYDETVSNGYHYNNKFCQ